jgi:hypothetical protein
MSKKKVSKTYEEINAKIKGGCGHRRRDGGHSPQGRT